MPRIVAPSSSFDSASTNTLMKTLRLARLSARERRRAIGMLPTSTRLRSSSLCLGHPGRVQRRVDEQRISMMRSEMRRLSLSNRFAATIS